MKNQSGRKKMKSNVHGRGRKRNKRGKGRSGFSATVLMILLVVLVAVIGIILLLRMFGQNISKKEKTENAVITEQEKMPESQENVQDSYSEAFNGSIGSKQLKGENNNGDWMLIADNINTLINCQLEMIEEYREERQISVSIMGDSISTFKGFIPNGYYEFFPDNGAVQDVNETWWKPLVEELDLRLYVNASSSGSTCTGDSTSQSDPQCGCSDLRINDLIGTNGKTPNIIIVYMGTNDLLQSVPLGDNNGTRKVAEGNIQNFSDAYTLMLDKLQQKYPDSVIYCCTITQIGTWGTDTLFVEFVNGAGEGLTAADYSECIRQIAENNNISVIDLYNCGIAVDNLQETTVDGVHPTPLGMSYIKEAIKEKLILKID